MHGGGRGWLHAAAQADVGCSSRYRMPTATRGIACESACYEWLWFVVGDCRLLSRWRPLLGFSPETAAEA